MHSPRVQDLWNVMNVIYPASYVPKYDVPILHHIILASFSTNLFYNRPPDRCKVCNIVRRPQQPWIPVWLQIGVTVLSVYYLIFVCINHIDLSILIQQLDDLKQCTRMEDIVVIKQRNVLSFCDRKTFVGRARNVSIFLSAL